MEPKKLKKMRWVSALVLAAVLLLAPGSLMALEKMQDAGKSKEITVEGTIQGFLTTCAGGTCQPGKEHIVAGMEDDYVLVTDSGAYYLLPNLKSTQLSRHLNRQVRVEGVQVLGGNVILVNKASVLENGKWVDFQSPDILDELERLRLQFPY